MNDLLRVLKVSWKFFIPAIYNFAVTYPQKFARSIFLKISLLFHSFCIVFSVYKQNFTAQ